MLVDGFEYLCWYWFSNINIGWLVLMVYVARYLAKIKIKKLILKKVYAIVVASWLYLMLFYQQIFLQQLLFLQWF